MRLDDYDKMLNKQGGKCAICKKDQIRDNLCVDHNHDTGKVRGLLCHKCNQAIGLLSDSATVAAQYLISHSKVSWNEYFMHMAILASSRSKDRSTKVGSVIVRDRVILSTGYNGFPRNINDDIEERHERPTKYMFTCHAEENAIFNAARVGTNVSNSDMYVTLHPCTGCAKAIVQSEVRNVFILSDSNERWAEEFEVSKGILSEAGVSVTKIELS